MSYFNRYECSDEELLSHVYVIKGNKINCNFSAINNIKLWINCEKFIAVTIDQSHENVIMHCNISIS